MDRGAVPRFALSFFMTAPSCCCMPCSTLLHANLVDRPYIKSVSSHNALLLIHKISVQYVDDVAEQSQRMALGRAPGRLERRRRRAERQRAKEAEMREAKAARKLLAKVRHLSMTMMARARWSVMRACMQQNL